MERTLFADLPDEIYEAIETYEKAKPNLYISLCNAEDNQGLLKEVPHRIIGEIAMTYRIFVNKENSIISCVSITNDLMEHFGIDENQLHEDAMKNAPLVHKWVICPLSDVLNGRIPWDSNTLVATNEYRFDGAAVIFYPEVKKELMERFGKKYFVIPTDSDQVLILPYSESKIDMYNTALSFVNKNIETNKKLADHVLVYDSASDQYLPAYRSFLS